MKPTLRQLDFPDGTRRELYGACPAHRHIHQSQRHSEPPLQRWHSEESIIQPVQPLPAQHHFQSYTHIRQVSASDRSDITPPPLPVRGSDAKPPLPPKPMQLYHAKPIHTNSDFCVSAGYNSNQDVYENCLSLELKMRPAPMQNRALHVIHNPLNKTASLQRRGSLDSMMDAYEPYNHYSSTTSSADSHDGDDLLSSITATFDEKLRTMVNPNASHVKKLSSDNSSLGSSVTSPTSQSNPSQPVFDQSRDSLLSNVSDKENINGADNTGMISQRGSNSSVNAPIKETKIGIASRIERKDMVPISSYAVSSSGYSNSKFTEPAETYHQHQHDQDLVEQADVEDNDFANNNILPQDYQDNVTYLQRHMSEDKKRIRRRHTVGGARDFEVLKDVISAKARDGLLNEVKLNSEPQHYNLTAWQRLQPRGTQEPASFRDWIERGRFRASSPELESSFMHLQGVGPILAPSVLQSNT